MVIRISLILAILAGLAIAGLNVSRVKQKFTNLESNLTAQTAARQQAESELTRTLTSLATTAATLKQTTTTLEAATADKQKALAVATAQTERAGKRTLDLAETRQARDDAQASLARYRAAGLEPEQIAHAASQIKGLQNALGAAEEKIKGLDPKVKRLAAIGSEGGRAVPLPSGLKAKVIASDPKWHFIVLDAGENQGVLERGELLLSRHGKLVAKARVSRVQNDRSIANLLPGWELVEIMEGDLVIPADPQS
jgi:flagellar biosynthesis chaperone FliJ